MMFDVSIATMYGRPTFGSKVKWKTLSFLLIVNVLTVD
jgi:hypothetical protein